MISVIVIWISVVSPNIQITETARCRTYKLTRVSSMHPCNADWLTSCRCVYWAMLKIRRRSEFWGLTQVPFFFLVSDSETSETSSHIGAEWNSRRGLSMKSQLKVHLIFLQTSLYRFIFLLWLTDSFMAFSPELPALCRALVSCRTPFLVTEGIWVWIWVWVY